MSNDSTSERTVVDGLELGADMCIRMARSESAAGHQDRASILEAAAFGIRALKNAAPQASDAHISSADGDGMERPVAAAREPEGLHVRVDKTQADMVLVPRVMPRELAAKLAEKIGFWAEPSPPEFELGTMVDPGMSEADAKSICEDGIKDQQEYWQDVLAAVGEPSRVTNAQSDTAQQLADALDDVKRLHAEKMKFFERVIELERLLSSTSNVEPPPEGWNEELRDQLGCLRALASALMDALACDDDAEALAKIRYDPESSHYCWHEGQAAFKALMEHLKDGPLALSASSVVTEEMVERALAAANGAMVDTRRHWTEGDRAAVKAMLEAVLR